ncbi:MAG: orotidine-5'-phosphate decarboxylase [Anaerolineae bacterium]|nr:orotidine-5'-phosphate decarboxylase [Anaerolineae bacterium]MDW8097932.1 orotidine-5'-phosphate decarboxylase [Anaerolineae bacterium]
MAPTFFEKLADVARRHNSLLCVGLDPHPAQVPTRFRGATNPFLAWNREIIERTADLACCFKPNIAFYEALDDGLETLRKTLAIIPDEVPVILDAKRGDIGSTAEAYAQAVFERLGVGAVTVSPYLGEDSVRPFSRYADRGVFVLCHTSNPGAADLQTLRADGRPLYLHVAERALRWTDHNNIGLVVGATYPQALAAVRAVASETWLLVPGVGAQGGDLEAAVRAGQRADGLGVIIHVSRGIAQADDPRTAAEALRNAINTARRTGIVASKEGNLAMLRPLILRLHDLGAVKFGQFTLASGRMSPIYVDLRLLVSDPMALRMAAQAYADRLHDLSFDRLAGVPYGALPIATVIGQLLGRPLIYPRKEAKQHGLGRPIEGAYSPGERAVIIEDVITSGSSVLEAAKTLRDAGLQVTDAVVLIDRGQGGVENLAAMGIMAHAVMRLEDMLAVLAEAERITTEQATMVRAYLTQG